MLIPQGATGEPDAGHGGPRISFVELRRRLDRPSSFEEKHRQRLLDLSQRLARVQALGDEYGRVEFSPYVSAALSSSATPV